MTETMDICAKFPFTRLSSRRCASTPDGSPIVRARQINERELRVFTLEAEDVPRQALERVKFLWDATIGPSQPMDFTPPDESAIQIRFRAGTFAYKIRSATAASFTVEFEEVR